MTEKIGFYSRDEEYGWLSNFHRCTQIVDHYSYPTNEHYYQSRKAVNEEFQIWIGSAPNPYFAMKAGRLLRAGKPGELVPDWENKKVVVMLNGLRAKFKNPELKKKLLATEDAYLYEDSPTDSFWGGRLPNSENMLGKLIMRVRDEVRWDSK